MGQAIAENTLMTATSTPFAQDAAFDPETTQIMGQAYESACRALDFAEPEIVKTIIAKEIIALAKTGERDTNLLCERALKGIRFSQQLRKHPAC